MNNEKSTSLQNHSDVVEILDPKHTNFVMLSNMHSFSPEKLGQ